jgi:outer membrane lipoprotein SlyB
MRISKLLFVALISVLLTGCASSNSGSVYRRDDARRVQTVKTGVVESVRSVKLEGT